MPDSSLYVHDLLLARVFIPLVGKYVLNVCNMLPHQRETVSETEGDTPDGLDLPFRMRGVV
jgi:hypothetical protein